MDETPQETNRINQCFLDVENRALILRKNAAFLEEAPTEWVMKIMKSLRKCALKISNYKEFREGLIETAALCFVIMEYSDRLFVEYLSKPAKITKLDSGAVQITLPPKK